MARIDLASFIPFRLGRAADLLNSRLTAMLAERSGIDEPQWRVLAALSNGAEWTAQDIVAATGTHKSTVSRALHQLAARRLVSRVKSGNDGRARVLALTERGRKVVDDLVPLGKAFERDIQRTLGKRFVQLEQCLDLLDVADATSDDRR